MSGAGDALVLPFKGKRRQPPSCAGKTAEGGRVSEGDQQPFWRGPYEDTLSTERQRARWGNWMVSSPDLSGELRGVRERRCRRMEETKMGRS